MIHLVKKYEKHYPEYQALLRKGAGQGKKIGEMLRFEKH